MNKEKSIKTDQENGMVCYALIDFSQVTVDQKSNEIR